MEADEAITFPRELDVDESNHAKFDDLAKSNFFNKKDAPMKEVFIYAMTLGYRNKIRVTLRKRKGSIPSATFKGDEPWLIKSIATAEQKELETLLDIKTIVNIAEEYANGGITLLYDLVFGTSPGDAYKKLDAHAREVANQNQPYEKSAAKSKITQLSYFLDLTESETLEFKSSLRWDYKQSNLNRAMEIIIAKSLVAFLNTKGGTLIIGVDDKKQILGLEKDFSALKKQDEDGFELKLTDIINTYVGKQYRTYVHVKFEKIDSKTICIVTIDKSSTPAYLSSEGKTEFYIRAGNSSQPLNVKETTEYITDHWK